MDGLIAYALAKKYVNNFIDVSFKVQVEPDRSILNKNGKEMTLYFLPKASPESQNNYDEYLYANNKWELVGSTDVNWVPTEQELNDIVDRVISKLPDADTESY